MLTFKSNLLCCYNRLLQSVALRAFCLDKCLMYDKLEGKGSSYRSSTRSATSMVSSGSGGGGGVGGKRKGAASRTRRGDENLSFELYEPRVRPRRSGNIGVSYTEVGTCSESNTSPLYFSHHLHKRCQSFAVSNFFGNVISIFIGG